MRFSINDDDFSVASNGHDFAEAAKAKADKQLEQEGFCPSNGNDFALAASKKKGNRSLTTSPQPEGGSGSGCNLLNNNISLEVNVQNGVEAAAAEEGVDLDLAAEEVVPLEAEGEEDPVEEGEVYLVVAAEAARWAASAVISPPRLYSAGATLWMDTCTRPSSGEYARTRV